MDALEAILTRRSIRRYTAEPVAEDLIKKLLEAAMYAPSAHNQQPWQFIVIQDRQVLDKIPEFHPHSSMLKSAPLAILVCGDSSRFKSPISAAGLCCSNPEYSAGCQSTGIGYSVDGCLPQGKLDGGCVHSLRYLRCCSIFPDRCWIPCRGKTPA